MRRLLAYAALSTVLTSAIAASGPAARAATVLFVVARPIPYQLGFGDSYVLPLSDPDHIAIARQLVQYRGFLIVFANVSKGSDGINRNVLAPGQPLWSWHVTECLGFDTAAIELCDGTPTFTERAAENWPAGDRYEICYWEYTVVDELGPLPVDSSTWGHVKARY